MTITVSWGGHLLTLGPEMAKHETYGPSAQFVTNVTSADDKVIEMDNGGLAAMQEAWGIPSASLAAAIAGTAYNIDGDRPVSQGGGAPEGSCHFWSRAMDTQWLLKKIPTSAQTPDAAAFAKALKAELGNVGGASIAEIEAALKKIKFIVQ